MADDFTQNVKQQADIVKIVGEYVRLKRAGAQNYSGLCPFHSEKTPSFSVHATRQFFHCFGCGASGDVFSFLQKIENIGFREAILLAAKKSGIPLPKREWSSPEEAREHQRRRKLLELQEKAASWFEQQLRLPEAARAREYLGGRGLNQAAIARFRIGYAPDSFHALRDYLASITSDRELLDLSGLCSSKPQPDGSLGPLYSRFRKRVTFPIRNEAGRVIAFTARSLSTDEDSGPKYLNSPETPLYSKGQVLFNLDQAKQAIRQLDFAVLVEGQMDCISVATAGVENTIATSGTAFTPMQARLLARFTKRLCVNFDPDTAGAAAAEKSIALLVEEGFEIKIVTLESGLDPDRFVRERGVAAYVTAIREARRFSEFLIDRALHLFPPRSAEAKSKAIHYLLPYIRMVPDSIVRDEFAGDAAQKLGIDAALVREELKQAARRRRDKVTPAVSDVPAAAAVRDAEKLLLRALASDQAAPAFRKAAEALTGAPRSFEGLSSFRLLRLLAERTASDPMQDLTEQADRALLASILLQEFETEEDTIAEEVEAALVSLRIRSLEQEQRRLRAAIADAERRGDWAEVTLHAAEKLEADRQIRLLSGPPAE